VVKRDNLLETATDNSGSDRGDGLDEAVAALRTFALGERETIADERDPSIETVTIRLHPLVRQIAAARCVGEGYEDARRELIEALAVVYPELELVYSDPNTWPRTRRLDAITLALVSDEADEPTAALIHRLAAYTQVRPLFERALAIREKTLGPEHPYTAIDLNNLARVLEGLSEHEGGQAFLSQAAEGLVLCAQSPCDR
jgi:hypothetical protein